MESVNDVCRLCPNDCKIDRREKTGACRSGKDMRICRIAPHFYEEPCISGTNGSGTIFFSGCGMDCSFCQNYEISKSDAGKIFSPLSLAEQMKKLTDMGVHNINLVTPTHFSDKIREALDLYRPPVPIVYNTSGYEKPEIIREMNSYVDIYLTDFKYADGETAKFYSRRENYPEYCIASIDEMVKSKPLRYDENGIMRSGVIVRHLYLPGERRNTEGVIEIFAKRWKDTAVFSFMSQFFPTHKSPIKRTLKPVEYKLALNFILSHGIENCYVQELSSADAEYVPEWDMI
ncbi:MAG: radical SAM protein [Christensenellales bacterium]